MNIYYLIPFPDNLFLVLFFVGLPYFFLPAYQINVVFFLVQRTQLSEGVRLRLSGRLFGCA